MYIYIYTILYKHIIYILWSISLFLHGVWITSRFQPLITQPFEAEELSEWMTIYGGRLEDFASRRRIQLWRFGQITKEDSVGNHPEE